MKLRGHHLFCTTLFSGHGYSDDFTERMNWVLSLLRQGEPAKLCVGSDLLCEVCPNRVGEQDCALSTENAAERDLAALRVLHLAPGETIGQEELFCRIRQLTEQKFQAVCNDCRWQKEGLCSYELLQERAAQNGG